MNPYDEQCIKSDVCDVVVCDGVYKCRYAVHKNMVRAQQAPNKPSVPCQKHGSAGIRLVTKVVCAECGEQVDRVFVTAHIG
jgi:hypothetical protein